MPTINRDMQFSEELMLQVLRNENKETETTTPVQEAEDEHGHKEHGDHVPGICLEPKSSCRLQRPVDCVEHECSKNLTVLIFPFLALFIGVIAVPTARRIRVPYTLLLLITGAALGALACAVDLGMLSHSLSQWVHLNPPAIFFHVFLAPLIFEASFNTRWHVFKRLLIPILTAAFLIVMLQVGLIAAFQKLVIRTADWSWYAALMFGAMLSATDPISVTATLKALGASEFLNTLIEGESLVNDGSAFVLWEAFFENTRYPGSLSVGDIIVKVIRLSLGGMIMGIAFGLAALVILGFLYDEFEVETSLTVIVAFLGFWTAQSPSKLSGVICNVASGLVISAFGRHLITRSVRGPLDEFWELLSWIANTIVFVHAGVLLTAFMWSCSGMPNKYYDYLHIFTYYAFLQVIRMGLILIFRPFMAIGNKWFQWKEAFVVGFSGLRGAVSLVLALEVTGAPISNNIKARVVLWTTGIVALSLLLNGFFIQPLIKMLGLDKQTKSREDFLNRGRAVLVQRSLMILDMLCIDTGFKAARWSYVVKNVLPESWLNESELTYKEAVDHLMDNTATSNSEALDSVRSQRQQQLVHTEIQRRLSHGMSLPTSPMLPSVQSISGFRRTDTPQVNRGEQAMDFSRSHLNMRVIAAASSINGAGYAMHRPNRLSVAADAGRYGEEQTAWNGHLWNQARIHSEVARMHELKVGDQRYELSEQDREVQRRLLTAILSHVRALANSTMVEFSVLHNLEQDCQLALDANEEGRDYNLFSFLDIREKHNVLYNAYLRTVEGRELRGQTAITTTMIVFGILTEILKMDILSSSAFVQLQAEHLYEGAAALLNRLESLNPHAFEWVQSQFAVYVAERKQDEVLNDMKNSGVIDGHEYNILRHELIAVRRNHAQSRKSLLRTKLDDKKDAKNLLKTHPLFVNLSPNLMANFVDRFGEIVRLEHGQSLQCEPGSLVVVLEGSLRPEDAKRDIDDDVTESEERNEESSSSSEEDVSQLDAPTLTMCTALRTGATTHWCFRAPAAIVGARTALCAYGDGEVAQNRTGNVKLRCCERACVFTLPVAQVEQLAKLSEEFRVEITRCAGRDVVLESVGEECPYQLMHFTESLTRVDVNTVVGRAFRILERLEYMRVVQVGEGTHVQGPGVVLNGAVRVSLVDVSGLVVLYDRVVGPALLPSGDLMVEGDGFVLVEVGDDSDGRRLRRWGGDVDYNGRFGMNRHIELVDLVGTSVE